MDDVLLNTRDAEMSILGSIMVNPRLFPKVLGYLTEEDFFFDDTRHVFKAMLDLGKDGLDINVKTVWNRLYESNYTGLSETELQEFLNYRADNEAVISFAIQVAKFSGHRLLQEGLEELSKAVKLRKMDLSDYVASMSKLASEVNSKGVRQEIPTGTEIVNAFYEMLGRDRSQLRLTGLPEFDANIFDFDAGETAIIAARPGTGKTAMMLQSARINVENGRRVGFLSLEMDRSKLMARLVAAKSEIDGSLILSMTPDQFHARGNEAAVEALKYFAHKPLFIDDRGPFTNVTVPQKIRRLVYEHGCEVIYLDYVGLIGAVGHLSSTTRNIQLGTISREIKGLANELEIPIVMAAQLNRAVTSRTNHRPMLSDLRDSGELEQDASIVMFLYADVESIFNQNVSEDELKEFMEGADSVNIKAEIAKQRNGPVQTKSMVFKKPIGTFISSKEYHATY